MCAGDVLSAVGPSTDGASGPLAWGAAATIAVTRARRRSTLGRPGKRSDHLQRRDVSAFRESAGPIATRVRAALPIRRSPSHRTRGAPSRHDLRVGRQGRSKGRRTAHRDEEGLCRSRQGAHRPHPGASGDREGHRRPEEQTGEDRGESTATPADAVATSRSARDGAYRRRGPGLPHLVTVCQAGVISAIWPPTNRTKSSMRSARARRREVYLSMRWMVFVVPARTKSMREGSAKPFAC